MNWKICVEKQHGFESIKGAESLEEGKPATKTYSKLWLRWN